MRNLATLRDVSINYPISMTNLRTGKTFFLNQHLSPDDMKPISSEAYTGPEHILQLASPLFQARESLRNKYGARILVDIQLESILAGEGNFSKVVQYEFYVRIHRNNGTELEELKDATLSFIRSVPFRPYCGNAPEDLFNKLNEYRPREKLI